MTNTLLPWLQKVKSNYVVTYHGDRVFSVKKAFQRLLKIAKGLPERISPYCIRHTMAKELRRRGVPPREVQGMLGHKAAGLRTTEIYAKYDPSYLRAARLAINEVMADINARTTKRNIVLPSQPKLVVVGSVS
ncbi:MAG: tyrosine-type recombinase/integrase [Rhizomicrobium sp.]